MSETDELLASAGDVSKAMTLPPRYYHDQSVYDLEIREIFEKEWLCVGRIEQVAGVGDYYTITVLDEPLIIVRGRDMQIRALSAVCRHRSMIITAPGDGEEGDWNHRAPETSGNCPGTFRCPYHFWQYGLDGALVSAPEMERTENFRTQDVRLPSLAVDVWQGFIFVNFDPTAEPLHPQLARVEELLEHWDLENMTSAPPLYLPSMPWNWKILQENSTETYHLDRLHFPRHFIEPSGGVIPHEFRTGDAAITFGIRAVHPDFALNPMGEPLFPVLESLTEQERQISYWALIPPTLLIGTNTDSAFYRIVLPTSAATTDIRQSYLTPPENLANPLYQDLIGMAAEFHITLNHQDWMANSNVHRGMQSRMAARGRYSWQEAPLVQFNNWLVSRYLRAASQSEVEDILEALAPQGGLT